MNEDWILRRIKARQILFMDDQSFDVTRPRPGFKALLFACRHPGGGEGRGFNKMSVNRSHGAAHIARAIKGSVDKSRDLTRRTEWWTINPPGWEKIQAREGDWKIKLCKPLGYSWLKTYKKQCGINSHSSLLDSFALEQAHTMFWKPWHIGLIPQLTCILNMMIATAALTL